MMTIVDYFIRGLKKGNRFVKENWVIFTGGFIFATGYFVPLLLYSTKLPGVLIVVPFYTGYWWIPQAAFGIWEVLVSLSEEEYELLEEELELVGDKYFDMITYQIMNEPVKLSTGDYYVDESTALKFDRCPYTRLPFTYEKQPELKKEMRGLLDDILEQRRMRHSNSENYCLTASQQSFFAENQTRHQEVNGEIASSSPQP